MLPRYPLKIAALRRQASLHHLLFGKRGQEPGGGPTLLVGGLRQGGPDEFDAGQVQFTEQQVDAGGRRFCRPLSCGFSHRRGDLGVDGERRDDNGR
jgi:hypothetical protein